ncbi:hypothetical protein SGLAM104S_04120 [Streptomyces glaucescens]
MNSPERSGRRDGAGEADIDSSAPKPDPGSGSGSGSGSDLNSGSAAPVSSVPFTAIPPPHHDFTPSSGNDRGFIPDPLPRPPLCGQFRHGSANLPSTVPTVLSVDSASTA